MPPSNI